MFSETDGYIWLGMLIRFWAVGGDQNIFLVYEYQVV
jgi:hypothetical protein